MESSIIGAGLLLAGVIAGGYLTYKLVGWHHRRQLAAFYISKSELVEYCLWMRAINPMYVDTAEYFMKPDHCELFEHIQQMKKFYSCNRNPPIQLR